MTKALSAAKTKRAHRRRGNIDRKTVTLRDRDSLEQVRVKIDEVQQVIRERINS